MGAVEHLPTIGVRWLALQRAEALVRQGWTQGAYWRRAAGGRRRIDLAHALELAAHEFPCQAEELYAMVLAVLPPPYCDDQLYGIERWNDVGYRSRSEVIAVLRAAGAAP